MRLHFVEEGDGPAVVLLHGFPDFWYSWRHQIVAWATASWHPDLVDRLVVMNAPHPDDYARGLRNPRQLRKSWYTGFFQLPGAAAALERDGYAALRKALVNSSLPGSFTNEDIERYVDALEPHFATPSSKLVTDLTVERIPDATHWVHLDRPERVNRAVLDFLA